MGSGQELVIKYWGILLGWRQRIIWTNYSVQWGIL